MQLAVLQCELDRMNTENQRLRAMLNLANNNYHALQMHISSLMQQQKQTQKTRTGEENEVVFINLINKKIIQTYVN